jgi:hypothetical protein
MVKIKTLIQDFGRPTFSTEGKEGRWLQHEERMGDYRIRNRIGRLEHSKSEDIKEGETKWMK